MNHASKTRTFALISAFLILFVSATFQAVAKENIGDDPIIDTSNVSYVHSPSTAENGMYVKKNLETGELEYFDVEVSNECLASYDGATERTAPAYFPPELLDETISSARITTRGIIGDDSRTRVTVSNALPYSAIGRIKITWPNGVITYGTAWMFYGDIAITAAHCIYNSDRGGWASSVQIWVGMNGYTSTARAVGYSRALYTSSLYISSPHVKDDWAVIELTEDIAATTGYLGISYTTADMSGRSIEISGYPSTWQYTASGTIDYCEEAALFYKVDTTSGQSGAPILIDGTNKATGIHTTQYYIPHETYNEYTKNGGARMTPSLFDYLLSFRD